MVGKRVMRVKTLKFLEAAGEYKYFILYFNNPFTIKNKYDKMLVFDLIGIIQFYSGDADLPVCALYIEEVKDVKITSTSKPDVDLISIERRDGKEISLYGFKVA